MNSIKTSILIAGAALFFGCGKNNKAESVPVVLPAHAATPNTPAEKTAAPIRYQCPMHPEEISDKPGVCPKCGMNLEPMAAAGETNEKK